MDGRVCGVRKKEREERGEFFSVEKKQTKKKKSSKKLKQNKITISAPALGKSTSSTSGMLDPSALPKMIACGLPMETQVTRHVAPPEATSPATTASSFSPPKAFDCPVEPSVVGICAGVRIGGPMSTRIMPSGSTSGLMMPAPVATAAVEFEEEVEAFELFFSFSSMSATKRARHLIPLPHISGSDPSLL